MKKVLKLFSLFGNSDSMECKGLPLAKSHSPERKGLPLAVIATAGAMAHYAY